MSERKIPARGVRPAPPRPGCLLRAIFGVVVGGAVLAAVYAWIGCRDLSGVDDAGARAALAPRPPNAENAYLAVAAATNFLACRGPATNGPAVVGLNAEGFAQLRLAAKCPHWYDVGVRERPLDDTQAEAVLSELPRMASLVRERIRRAAAADDFDAVLEDLDVLLGLAGRLVAQGELARTWCTGVGIRDIAVAAVGPLARSGQVPDAVLAGIAERLDRTARAGFGDFRRLLHSEYVCRFRMFEGQLERRTAQRQFSLNLGGREVRVGPSDRAAYILQLNRSRALMLRLLDGHVIPGLEKGGYDAAAWNRVDAAVERETGFLGFFPFRNVLGNFLVRALVPDGRSLARTRADAAFVLDAARVRVAAERFRRARDREPGSLEELVPDFLPSVPQDPYRLVPAPLGYDPALGVVWTVGRNGSFAPVASKSAADPYGPGSHRYARRVAR